ncbi:MAG TPA: class II aldolase/adducin family protein [Polyangia bacterium]|nr:class II aldolase/adducin family protein [Polyangia bacterium]
MSRRPAARAGREVLETVRWLAERRLYTGTSGNVSSRVAGGFVVTPTGIACDVLAAADMVTVAADGRPRGKMLPSSEWRLHRDIYVRRPEVGAVVHTHSPFATALSSLRRPIPAFHYMVAKTGGAQLRCARYATYGTDALSKNALTALDGRRACLLANHGVVVLGADLKAARLLAEEIELLALQYVVARAAGSPAILPAAEMARVAQKFAGYGQARPRSRAP